MREYTVDRRHSHLVKAWIEYNRDGGPSLATVRSGVGTGLLVRVCERQLFRHVASE